MIFLVQVILLIACFRQSIPAKVEEVNTRWTYRDGKGNNAKSLPDHIEIVLEVEGSKLTMNLMKFSMKSPLIMTQFKGSRSIWETSEDENQVGIYKDPSVDASATVAIKNVEGIEEILYTISFSYGNKSYSVEPGVNFSDKPSFEKFRDVTVDRKNYRNSNSRLLIIDRKPHSLLEIPKATLRQDVHLNKEQLEGLIKKTRTRKRSEESLISRHLTVEMFTVIDFTIFNKYFTQSKATSIDEKKEDARKTIKYFFTHIMEAVNKNYESISRWGLKISVKWVGALIAESPSDVPFIESDDASKINSHTVNAGVVLEKMAEWTINEKAEGKQFSLPNYDFIAVFTSYSISDNKRRRLAGQAHNQICTPSSSAIVKYEHLLRTSSVTSHELGHAFGMLHDENICGINYIMEPSFVDYSKDNIHNAFTFSICSIAMLMIKIDDLDELGMNCLTDGGNAIQNDKERNLFLYLFPGRIYHLDDQCKMLFGPESFYCGGSENDQVMCENIKCYKNGSCRSKALLNAMDGTTCSKGSWCRRGQCKPDRNTNIKAQRAPERCTNGDSKLPLLISGNPTCNDFINQDPDMCNDKELKNLCCASCEGNRTKNRGCQDTIDECSRLAPGDCYSSYYATTCCKTCSAFVSNSSDTGCLYGDMDDRCSLMVPSICHLNSRFCCKTCAAYLQSTKTKPGGFSFSITTNGPPSTVLPTASLKTMTFSVSSAITGISNHLETNHISPVSTETTSLPSTVQPLTTTIDSTITSSKKPTLFNDSCIQGDFTGILEYVSFWHDRKNVSCKELVDYDSKLCYYQTVQSFCCSSCSNIKTVDFCKHGEKGKRWEYRQKYFTCNELVEYDRNMCKFEHVKNSCCQSCGLFTIRALED